MSSGSWAQVYLLCALGKGKKWSLRQTEELFSKCSTVASNAKFTLVGIVSMGSNVIYPNTPSKRCCLILFIQGELPRDKICDVYFMNRTFKNSNCGRSMQSDRRWKAIDSLGWHWEWTSLEVLVTKLLVHVDLWCYEKFSKYPLYLRECSSKHTFLHI